MRVKLYSETEMRRCLYCPSPASKKKKRKGKERKGKERKGKERKGKKRKADLELGESALAAVDLILEILDAAADLRVEDGRVLCEKKV